MFFHHGMLLALLSLVIGTVRTVEISSNEPNNTPIPLKPPDALETSSVPKRLKVNNREHAFKDNRYLQSIEDVLTISLSAVSLIFESFLLVIQNFVEMTSDIGQDIVEEGIDLGQIADVMGESFVEIVVGVSTNVASFLVEDFIFLLQDTIRESLSCLDPFNLAGLDVTSNALAFNITENDGCTVTININEILLRGLSNFEFDTFEVNDFSYEENQLDFDLNAVFFFPGIGLNFVGDMSPVTTCVGGFSEFLAISSFDEIYFRIATTVSGEITDEGSVLTVTAVDFSTLEIQGLDNPSTELSDIAPYSEFVGNTMLSVFQALTQSLNEVLISELPNKENFLEFVGVELPTTVTLPIPFPF